MHLVRLVAHSADVQMLAFVLVFRHVASSTLLKSVFLTREHTKRVFIPSTCNVSACSISLCSCAEWGRLCALHCFLGKKRGRKFRTQHAFKPVLLDLLRHAQMSQHTFIQELSPSERAALSTPELWVAKDHVAHMTFWRQRLVLRLQALIGKTTQPASENFEQLNTIIFEEQRSHS